MTALRTSSRAALSPSRWLVGSPRRLIWFDIPRADLGRAGRRRVRLESVRASECRPLLAIADYDEALMYARRRGPGDTERARPFLDAARAQFETIGMTGWLRRADELATRLD